MPAGIVNLDSSPAAASAAREMARGVRSMLSRTLRVETRLPGEDAWVLGTAAEVHAAKLSGIMDNQGRVGHYPNRTTAADMKLEGYSPVAVTPWETASGGKAYLCGGPAECRAISQFRGGAGWYDVAVEYFDYRQGASKFDLRLNGQMIGAWVADNTLPGEAPNGDTSRAIPCAASHCGRVTC